MRPKIRPASQQFQPHVYQHNAESNKQEQEITTNVLLNDATCRASIMHEVFIALEIAMKLLT